MSQKLLAWITLAITILISIAYFLIIESRTTNIIASEERDKVLKIYLDAFEHLVPMIISVLFGMLGAIAKNLIDMDESDIALQVNAGMLINNSTEQEGIGKPKLEREYKIDRHTKLNNIALGAIFGVVGYLLLSSHFLVRILYPEVNNAQMNVTFVGIAIVGMLFGYFAREFAGFSRKIVEERLQKLVQAEIEKK